VERLLGRVCFLCEWGRVLYRRDVLVVLKRCEWLKLEARGMRRRRRGWPGSNDWVSNVIIRSAGTTISKVEFKSL